MYRKNYMIEKNITIEISGVTQYDLRVVLIGPSKIFTIFKDGKELDGKDLGEPEEDSDEENEYGKDGEEDESDD